MSKALYIALEGIECCGKTTQATRLANHLGAQLTRESGGTDIGQMIRQIVVHHDHAGDVDPWCEAMLFAADRAQHVTEVVGPAMENGKHVVSDRSLWSSIAYQGYGRGLDVEALLEVNHQAVKGLYPDLVIFIDITYEQMLQRLGDRQRDRIEKSGVEFFARVLKGFDSMRHWADCDRWLVVPGTGSVAEVSAEINAQVDKYLAEAWS